MMMRSITNQKIKDEQQSKNHIKNQEDRVVKSTTYNAIPNMINAYQKVQQSNHKQSEEEIAYRQFSTSGYVPHD